MYVYVYMCLYLQEEKIGKVDGCHDPVLWKARWRRLLVLIMYSTALYNISIYIIVIRSAVIEVEM